MYILIWLSNCLLTFPIDEIRDQNLLGRMNAYNMYYPCLFLRNKYAFLTINKIDIINLSLITAIRICYLIINYFMTSTGSCTIIHPISWYLNNSSCVRKLMRCFYLRKIFEILQWIIYIERYLINFIFVCLSYIIFYKIKNDIMNVFLIIRVIVF